MNQSELPGAEVQRVFVFTDLVNSTGVKSQMSGQDQTERDRAYRDSILLPHRKRVERDLSSYGGRVVEMPGDGYFLVFESVAKAVQWAVQLQQDHQQNPIATPQGRQKVKIGLHFGSALAEGPQFIGQAVDYAARVASLGVGDQIILSEAAKALLDNAQVTGLRCRALGERFLKGIGQVPVFEVLYEGYPSTSSKAAQLKKVSLEQDLEHLTKQYEAVDGQYRFETNPATKINLKAQREHLLKQIQSVEEELNSL
ncbi:MAG: adenylate/guanylate cyclase domain-containing protein [Cyanobacteriota bacterium]|jgi:class 3 adenylate cyclase